MEQNKSVKRLVDGINLIPTLCSTRRSIRRGEGACFNNSYTPQSLLKVKNLKTCASELRVRLDGVNGAVIADVNRSPVKRERVRNRLNVLKTSKKVAFTLAEVLITLGVIGIVAAMTIPTLLSKYKDKELETRYKKAKSIILNAYKLMMAENNTFSILELPIYNCSDAACYAQESKKVFRIISDSISGIDTSKYVEKYYKSKEEKSAFLPSAYAEDDDSIDFNWDDVPYVFQVQDGMLYGILSNTELTSLDVFVDVNSANAPNRVRKDLYKFRLSGTGSIADVSSELEDKAKVGCYADLMKDLRKEFGADVNEDDWDTVDERLSACATQSECLSLKGGIGHHVGTVGSIVYKPTWQDGKCVLSQDWDHSCGYNCTEEDVDF